MSARALPHNTVLTVNHTVLSFNTFGTKADLMLRVLSKKK